MKELLKKYWFIGIIACLLITGIFYFAYETNKNKISGKKDNGENVVYSIGDQNITASEFYDSLYETIGASAIAQKFQYMVIDQSMATTDEMIATADENYDYTIQQYKTQYGADYEEILLLDLITIGYDKIEDYKQHVIISLKYNEIMEIGIDELFESYMTDNKPRSLSHILVSIVDGENPTAEEMAKLEEVKKALADGRDFGEVALEFSDDEGSAVSNGALGFTDVLLAASYVEPFATAAMELEAGETSEWVQSEFGYHIILCGATDYDTLMAEYPNEFGNAILGSDVDWLSNYIFTKANEFGIEFTDPAVEAEIMKIFNYDQPEPTPSATPDASETPDTDDEDGGTE